MMHCEELFPFERSGIAALSDMRGLQYQNIFALLEREQEGFLSKEALFRSTEYKWPRDPLHCWSRIWEYPYVYFHLKKAKEILGLGANPKVVDLGSGVTFFPFAVARMGYHVQCLDIDPTCEHDLHRAALAIPHEPGSVNFSLITNEDLPLCDSEVDVLYCISVLEHIHAFERTILEVARVLKAGGLLILTIDMDLCGYLEVGKIRYDDMRYCLNSLFEIVEPETTIHPLDMLIQYKNISLIKYMKFMTRQIAGKVLGKRFYHIFPNLAVWGGVMRKRHIPFAMKNG